MTDIKQSDVSAEELMALALAGDREAYSHVLRVISEYISRYLSKKLPPRDREDVIQEILLSIHKARFTYDNNRPLMPWVMAITRFRLNDYWRKQYGYRLAQDIDIDDIKNILWIDETKSMEDHEDISRVIKSLPPKQREVIDLMYRQDKSVQEVADILNISVSAVKVAAHRSYKIFRTRLMS